jgi:hypothetical protein
VVTTPEQFGTHWSKIVESCLNRFDKVGGFPIRYEVLIRKDYDLKPLAAYLGFDPDPAVRELKIGEAPKVKLDMEEMERLQKVVAPVADQIGYRNPFTNGS